MVLSVGKTEKQNSQGEHGQPMEQTRGLFCRCDSGVAHCQSQHFRQMSLMSEAYCTGKLALQLSIKLFSFMRLRRVAKDSLKVYLENVNIASCCQFEFLPARGEFHCLL